jgi:hypothetical protein
MGSGPARDIGEDQVSSRGRGIRDLLSVRRPAVSVDALRCVRHQLALAAAVAHINDIERVRTKGNLVRPWRPAKRDVAGFSRMLEGRAPERHAR